MAKPANDIVEIRTIGKEGNETVLRLKVVPGYPSAVQVLDGKAVLRSYEADHLLAALRKLREEYETHGITLLCKGARADVWPSGMAISMSSGRKVYVTKIGVQPRMEDLVDIFEPELIENTAPVAAQIAHQETWHAHWREFHKKK